MQNITEIENLIKLISKLPGLGPKSAKRIVLKLINNRDEMIKAIAQGKVEVTGGISWNDDQMKASPQYAIR